MCLTSFCPGLQLEEMTRLIKLFIHSFLYALLEFFSPIILMVNFTKLFTVALGVGLADLLSHELYLQIQWALILLLPSPTQ